MRVPVHAARVQAPDAGVVRWGAGAEDTTVVRVPGAFEIPSAVSQVLGSRNVDAVITLGCLIKGDTIHFDLIAQEVTRSIGQLALAFEVPISFGVLTTDTLEQAIHRAGAKAGNKGGEAALAAVEQVRHAKGRNGGVRGLGRALMPS